jgi:hypothetical protein
MVCDMKVVYSFTLEHKLLLISLGNLKALEDFVKEKVNITCISLAGDFKETWIALTIACTAWES